MIDTTKFNKKGAKGCCNSQFVFVKTTCCNQYGVEDYELHDFYYNPNDLTKVIQLYNENACLFCGSKEWGHSEATQDESEYFDWRWVNQ